MRQSNTITKTLLAFEKGYRVQSDGSVIGPTGITLKLGQSKAKYKRFTMTSSQAVFVHLLAAYQKFGEAAFEEGILVRHKNSNSLDNSYDNLLIGTLSDNAMDIPKEVRIARAKKAAKSRRKLSDSQVKDIRKAVSNGVLQKTLAIKYNVVKSTISGVVNNKYYTEV